MVPSPTSNATPETFRELLADYERSPDTDDDYIDDADDDARDYTAELVFPHQRRFLGRSGKHREDHRDYQQQHRQAVDRLRRDAKKVDAMLENVAHLRPAPRTKSLAPERYGSEHEEDRSTANPPAVPAP